MSLEGVGYELSENEVETVGACMQHTSTQADKSYRLLNIIALQPVLIPLAGILATLAAALNLVPYFAVAKMTAVIFKKPVQYDKIQEWVLIILVALVFRYVLLGLTNIFAHISAFRILHQLRMEIAQKLSGVPLSFFAKRTSGEIKKTMMDDVNKIESFVAHNFPDAVAAFVVPTFAAIALMWIDWRMTLASIAMAPFAFAAMAVAMRDIGKAHQQWNEIQERMNSSILEYLRGIQVIKTFGLSASKFGDLTRSIEDGLSWMEGFTKTNGRGYGAFGTLIGSSLLVLVPLGGWLFLTNRLSLENLVLFLILGPQLLMGMMRLMFMWGNVDHIRQGLNRVGSILNAPSLPQPVLEEFPKDHGISFSHVGFSYDEKIEVLKDVSIHIPEGTVTALVGPSGAGKTTLARLVPRLWDCTSGSVSIGGADIRQIPLDDLLARISFVFQDVFLFYGTIMENLKIGKNEATDEEVVNACKLAQAHDFISALPQGYQTMLGERGARLSGGEKQRISIARALLKNAPILILDEATSFSDPENEAKIQDALSELCRGKTVLVIAHRLSTIAAVDQIVVLEAGSVQDKGTHEELLKRCPLYYTLWKNHSTALSWTISQNAEVPQ